MMNKYEDPIQFNLQKSTREIELTYLKLTEICQGGPEIGHLTINGVKMSGLFGGPAIIDGYYVYIPLLVNKVIGRGFKLAVIDNSTFEVRKFGRTKSLIFLDPIENNKLFFFENIDKAVERCFELQKLHSI